MKTRLLPLVALLLALVPACRGISDASYQFQYEAERLEEVPTEPLEITTFVLGPGAFMVRGSTTTPCFFDRIVLDAKRSGSTLTVRIVRDAQTPCTNNTVRYHNYTAFFNNLPSGTYIVRVENTISGGTVVESETSVSIP